MTMTSPGRGTNLKRSYAWSGAPAEPRQKPVRIVDLPPLGDVAQEDVAARQHVDEVEQLGLVFDVLLEAEAFAGPLKEHRVAERARRLDGVGLVLEQESELLLKRRQFPQRRPIERRRQLLLKERLEPALGLFEDGDRRIGSKLFDKSRQRG